jgi:hypothetical protein
MLPPWRVKISPNKAQNPQNSSRFRMSRGLNIKPSEIYTYNTIKSLPGYQEIIKPDARAHLQYNDNEEILEKDIRTHFSIL